MGMIEVLNSVVNEMTEDEEEKVEKCINLHFDHLLEETITEYYITEENATTVRGKYWNCLWSNDEPMIDEEVNKISQYYYLRCLMSH